MTECKEEECYCLVILRKKWGDEVEGDCLKLSCGRYRREKRKEKEGEKGDLIDRVWSN